MSTVDHLIAEGDDLDVLVHELPTAEWSRATPAAGWSIAHQIGHLAWTDEVTVAAATDPGAFAEVLARAADDPLHFTDTTAAERAELPAAQLLSQWRAGRAQLADLLRALPDDTSIPWFGPPMKPRSMATARLMETWAHGQDVADALGVRRVATDRLRDIAHLGVRTRGFAYTINGLPVPAAEPRVELTAPSGEVWTWGPEDATDRVTGPAEDFCLAVTQRRELPEVDLVATPGAATQWLTIAQAFAGAPKAAVRAAHTTEALA
ncbi:TIGR03084 family metal-binding protein [Branchiibius sp. NY16-3462-2]|uniref:TIGR03084 family metal-binding protein n=1 Tax=Branchiibius sp. NY16-3462-2 TaxID=1807500 RepID=UPI0007994856|nr:TIGR03084 family metal-binding protein [Branchiibius sp. NY16-3462-2]KYH44877.1 wyosine base formation domain-containing protein [Branchiibius sp. NY16-3462-2]